MSLNTFAAEVTMRSPRVRMTVGIAEPGGVLRVVAATRCDRRQIEWTE